MRENLSSIFSLANPILAVVFYPYGTKVVLFKRERRRHLTTVIDLAFT